MHKYKFKVPTNVQKYFDNNEIKVTSEMPLRESEGGNIYGIGITTVKSAITFAIYQLTDGYKEDELHTFRENNIIRNLEHVHVAGHLGIVIAELHSDKVDYTSEICVVNKYNGNMKKGDWVG